MIDHVERTGSSLSELEMVVIGGSAAPPATIRWLRDRGVRVMTLGNDGDVAFGTVGVRPSDWDSMTEDEQIAYTCRAGRAVFGVELRIVDDEGQSCRGWRNDRPLADPRGRRRAALLQAGPGLHRQGRLVRHG